jgi:nitrogen regulatory protein PII
MKKVEAIIAPYALDTVTEMLVQRGCDDIVISQVRGSHGGPGRMNCYRGTRYVENPLSVKLEAVVEDEEAMPIVEAILQIPDKSSNFGYQVNVFPLEQVTSIGISRLVRYAPANRTDPGKPAMSRLPRLPSGAFIEALLVGC